MFDLAPSEEQQQLCAAVRSLLGQECSTDVVRRSEELGHDRGLWARLAGMGLADPVVPTLDLALVAEALGGYLAPVPVIESAVATGLVTRLDEVDLARDAESGRVVLSLALRPPVSGRLLAVPSGAVARHVVFLDGERLGLSMDPTPGQAIANLGGLAVADRTVDGHRVLATGSEGVALYQDALASWKALTAAWLVGAGRRALQLGIDYACERDAFGVKVASFQAIAHRLTEVATALDAAGLLVYEAAWAHEHRPDEARALSTMAYILAAEAAGCATRDALHVFGGYGFMLEYDIQLYFRRVKAVTLLAGDLSREPELLADQLWGAA